MMAGLGIPGGNVQGGAIFVAGVGVGPGVQKCGEDSGLLVESGYQMQGSVPMLVRAFRSAPASSNKAAMMAGSWCVRLPDAAA